MVEYTYEEAVALLEGNLATALDKQVRVYGMVYVGERGSFFVASFSVVPFKLRFASLSFVNVRKLL